MCILHSIATGTPFDKHLKGLQHSLCYHSHQLISRSVNNHRILIILNSVDSSFKVPSFPPGRLLRLLLTQQPSPATRQRSNSQLTGGWPRKHATTHSEMALAPLTYFLPHRQLAQLLSLLPPGLPPTLLLHLLYRHHRLHLPDYFRRTCARGCNTPNNSGCT